MQNKSKSKPIIFCSAKTQYENLGDLIINKTLIDNLRAFGDVIANDQGVPQEFLDDLSLEESERSSYYNLNFRLLMLFLCFKARFFEKRTAHYVMQPGHVYGTSSRFVRLQLFELIYLFVLKIMDVQISRFGSSIGPFSHAGNILERWKSKVTSFYSVRDSLSKEYGAKIKIENIHSFPDLAWLMDPYPVNGSVESGLRDGYVVISFRDSTHSSASDTNYVSRLFKVLDTVTQIVCQAHSKQLVVSYQVERDGDLCKLIRDRYASRYELVFIEERIQLQNVGTFYSKASMVFSNRLHVLLLGMLHNALPFAITDKNHTKVLGILSDADLLDSIIDLDACPGTVTAALERVLSRSEYFKSKISQTFQKNRALGHKKFCDFFIGYPDPTHALEASDRSVCTEELKTTKSAESQQI